MALPAVKPLLIMLPGTDGTGVFFESLTEALSPYIDVKVIAYPQSGDQSYATLGARLIGELPVDRDYILLGESFGGPLAIWLAVHAPNPPIKLILGASFAASPFGLLGRIVSPLVAIGRILPLWTWQIQLMLFNGGYAEVAQMVHETVKPIPRTTLLARVKAVLACDMRPILPRMTQPVLYIHANNDRLLPSFLPRQLAGFRNLQITRLDLPHMIFQCAPDTIAETVLLPFIRET